MHMLLLYIDTHKAKDIKIAKTVEQQPYDLGWANKLRWHYAWQWYKKIFFYMKNSSTKRIMKDSKGERNREKRIKQTSSSLG